MSEEKIAEVLSGYQTLDSGQREEFSSGARRDTQQNKPRFELIPVAPLKRLAALYERGAKKYGLGNFQKGIPFMRVMASLLRHAYQFLEGDETEDHLSACAWNAFAIMYYQDKIQKGCLPATLDDREVENA